MTDEDLLKKLTKRCQTHALWSEEENYNFYSQLRSRLKELIEIEWEYKELCK